MRCRFRVFERQLRGASILELGPAEGVMTELLADTGMALTVAEGSAGSTGSAGATGATGPTGAAGAHTLTAPIVSTSNSRYTVLTTDYTVLCNFSGGTKNVTLPTAAAGNSGRIYIVKKIGSSDCTVVGTSGGSYASGGNSVSPTTALRKGRSLFAPARSATSVARRRARGRAAASLRPTAAVPSSCTPRASRAYRRCRARAS